MLGALPFFKSLLIESFNRNIPEVASYTHNHTHILVLIPFYSVKLLMGAVFGRDRQFWLINIAQRKLRARILMGS